MKQIDDLDRLVIQLRKALVLALKPKFLDSNNVSRAALSEQNLLFRVYREVCIAQVESGEPQVVLARNDHNDRVVLVHKFNI